MQKKLKMLKLEGHWDESRGKICFFRQSLTKYMWKSNNI